MTRRRKNPQTNQEDIEGPKVQEEEGGRRIRDTYQQRGLEHKATHPQRRTFFNSNARTANESADDRERESI